METVSYPRCTELLRESGVAYPRTCQECWLGPCKRKVATPSAAESGETTACGFGLEVNVNAILENSIRIGHGSISLKCDVATIQKFVDRMVSVQVQNALAAGRKDAWQPIETAPKDGTEIWAAQSGSPERGVIYWEPEYHRWQATAENDDEPNWKPTIWQPLPAAPDSGQAV